jgi:phosphomethylpyrimidine synthase
LFATLEKQAKEGVDFFSIQASLDRSLLERLPNSQKHIPITSRGGAMLAEQMKRYDIENPFITLFPDILDLCSHYSITLSLVGALRPGTITDAFNKLHLEELGVQKQLIELCRQKKVQVMVELINHVPLNGLNQYGELASTLFRGVPYGALGPTTTDIAINYDDVVGAIGAAQAVSMGTSWINLVTAAEHTYFPGIEQLERALKFYQIALHIGHISRFGNMEKDATLSKNRNINNWSGIIANCMFPGETEILINNLDYKDGRACSLCDKQCPLVRMRSVFKT